MRTDPLMALMRSILSQFGLAGGVRLVVAASAVACMHCGGGGNGPANTNNNQTQDTADAQGGTPTQGTNPPSTGSSGSNTPGNPGGSVQSPDAGAPSTNTTPPTDDDAAASAPGDAAALDAGTPSSEGGTQTGAADAGGFNPCQDDGGPCKILPFGDSITYGIEYPGAYRVELFHDALSDHKHITFVGDPTLADGPAMVDGVAFPMDNQGHSGWTIAQVTGLVPSPALDANPDIILLHIGTNDMYTTTNPVAQAPQRLGMLIDKIVAADPHALLVVAQITPLATAMWETQVQMYNAALPAIVQPRIAAGKHVVLVDMHTGFTVSTMLSMDGVHPNQTGYNHMGDVWYAAIKGYLH